MAIRHVGLSDGESGSERKPAAATWPNLVRRVAPQTPKWVIVCIVDASMRRCMYTFPARQLGIIDRAVGGLKPTRYCELGNGERPTKCEPHVFKLPNDVYFASIIMSMQAKKIEWGLIAPSPLSKHLHFTSEPSDTASLSAFTGAIDATFAETLAMICTRIGKRN